MTSSTTSSDRNGTERTLPTEPAGSAAGGSGTPASSPTQSLERAFHLLGIIATAEDEVGVSELARRSGLAKSTTARLLRALRDLGAVETTPSGGHRIGPTIGALNVGNSDSPDLLRQLARPALVELAEELGEHAVLVVLHGGDALYLDQVSSPSAVDAGDFTGETHPPHAAASGQALMADWSRARLHRYLQAGPLPFTERTLLSAEELGRRFDEMAATGVAWSVDEYAEDVSGCAAPVVDANGDVVASIGSFAPTYRFPADGSPTERARISRAVAQAAASVGALLAGAVE